MPAAKKVSWAQLKVGLLAAVALAVLVFLILLMSGENPLFRKSVPVYVYLGDAAAVVKGAPVRLNGILVGEVKEVGLSNDNDPRRTVRLTLDIDENYLSAIPNNSEARLAQTSLLSARYVNIKKGTSAQPVQEGGELSSQTSTELEELFEQGNSTLAAMRSIMVRVESLVAEIEDGKGTIGKFLRDEALYNNLVSTTDEMRKLVVTFNQPNSTLGRLINEDDLYQDFRGTMASVNMLIDGLQAGEGTLGKLLKDDALHEDLRMTITDLRETLRLVNTGEGTIGKLLTTDTLHTRLEGTMTRIDDLLDKINRGEGTLGQLVVNPQLYESLDGMTREMHGLLQDFRTNPAKFLRIRVSLF
jgi:phospholipid/cholesterol/gamma-HCH transport system substrate-binding protein